MFPLIAYYICPDCENDIVQESFVFITSNLLHDSEAVTLFTKEMIRHVSDDTNVEHVVQFSDGCASQFKSKVPFFHLSNMEPVMERSYFGSRHGKGPCDALGGLVKKKAEMYVKTRKETIQNASQLYS